MASALTPTGSTRRWRRIRAAVLVRDGHRCRYCDGPADSVDHVLARIDGGTDDPANLVAACMACNLARRSQPPRRQRRGRWNTKIHDPRTRREGGVLARDPFGF